MLHLSRLPPPGPRPHHRRLVAALLDETAERCAGQLFGLADGDLALLFRPPDDGAAATALITRLFEAELPDPASLRSLWPLPDARDVVLADLRARLRAPPPARLPEDGTGPPDGLAPEPAGRQPKRQTAIRLRPGSTERMVPVFRELLTWESRAAERPTLDAVLLALRTDEAAMQAGAVPLHLNLTPGGVVSEGFARLAAACEARRAIRLSIEVALDEALADPATFQVARERLRLAGMGFVLDQVGHEALRVTRPEALDPGWVKLRWDPALPGSGPEDAIRRLGPDRVVLTGCGTEAALVWGLGAGLERFQGDFVDTMLAAERMRACPAAAGCRLAQCRERAGSIQPAGRAGCRHPALLNAAPSSVAAGHS